MRKRSLERAVEQVAVDLIKRQLGPFNEIPVLRSDESDYTETFSSVIVTATRDSDPLVIDESNHLQSTLTFEVRVDCNSLATSESTDKLDESDVWNEVEEAMRSTNQATINLTRFKDFYVLPGSSSETETDGDGRKTRTRVYSIAVEEDRSAPPVAEEILPPPPPEDEMTGGSGVVDDGNLNDGFVFDPVTGTFVPA
jgi:hypothetical protein